MLLGFSTELNTLTLHHTPSTQEISRGLHSQSPRTWSAVRASLVLARSSCAPGSGDPGFCETWRSAGTVPLGKTRKSHRGRFLRQFRADSDAGAAEGLPALALACACPGSVEQLAAEPLRCPGAFLPSATGVRAPGPGSFGAWLRTSRPRPPLSRPSCHRQQRPC